MSYKSQDVANYIVEYHNSIGKPISNLRLQKLLYFTQGLSYMRNQKKLFESNFEAWRLGPVDVDVYSQFAHNGSSPISTEQLPKKTQRFDDFSFENGVFIFNYDDIKELDSDAKKIVEDTVNQLISKTTSALVEATHNQKPWLEVKEENNIHKPISDEAIGEFFMESIKE
ncbi:DUF4065 domain-containing protein [Erysipelothrix rhusiopathiae]|nr:DUF4065 domain-containing protein [Erysipelothrix rhusiopathiae]MDE8252278.1 DUF4065 domain-containing protein [Erysipelothrix rhusiopathiae]MDE8260742.1 DUF4065 domain-containing protein [Erysipelothrix rhusiopathiae]MDE8265812.1 DUF4065 domain-containing protein [Erysipelothrix rhusiopathiae]MDE8267537.1 DUF4065 domain-containing protein [Erysipelothrix rhusiopathiae]